MARAWRSTAPGRCSGNEPISKGARERRPWSRCPTVAWPPCPPKPSIASHSKNSPPDTAEKIRTRADRVRVTFLGVRGSTPAPGEEFLRYGGHTSCVAIAHDGEAPSLLLDAGTGIRRTSSLMDGEPFRGSALLTHLHWDHVHGLPFCRSEERRVGKE